MRTTRWGRVCLLASTGLFLCIPAYGQTTGEIRGTVKDPSGAVVQGAAVNATLTGTDSTRQAVTGGDGAFDIPELAVGTYSVSTSAQGFKKFVANNVAVSIGHVTVVNIALQVGGSVDTVTVEANAAQVETTSTQIGAVMTDTAIRELPLSTRNTYQLLQLQPGVQSQLGSDLFYGSDSPGAVSVNGGRGRANNYMVNGGDGNDIFVNGPAIQPSPDAIEEFRVITNTFDAEYGRNSGSVVNVVTKSGTNAIHGDIYEFLRNDIFDTHGYFDPIKPDGQGVVPEWKQNQFGGTIGFPIKKDKTFLFGSYEGNRLRQGISSGNVTLPTNANAAGDFSAAGPSAFQGTLSDAPFAQTLQNRTGCSAALTPAGQNALTMAAGGTPQPYSSIFGGNNIIPTQCFDPTAAALYQIYVKPFTPADSSPYCNVTGVLGCQISTVPVRDDRGDQFTLRFDHHITANQIFTAYYYFDDDDRVDPFSTFQAAGANLPNFGAIFKTRIQQWNLSHTWTIGSSAVNEFRFNYFREGQKNLNHPVNLLTGPDGLHDACTDPKTGTVIVPASQCFTAPTGAIGTDPRGITTNIPGHEGVPDINVLGGFTIGNNFEGELPQVGNTFQWTDNYTKTFGKHTIKFGGDVRRQRFDQFLYFEINGYYQYFSGGADDVGLVANGQSNSYPDFLLGLPGAYDQGAAQGEDLRNSSLYLFAQDSYKLKSNLTLNYGLRWELNTPYYDTGNRLQTFRPGVNSTEYPCVLNTNNPTSQILATVYGSTDCSPNGPANAVFPQGLVFPGEPGVPRGLTQTYYKSWAPRIGIAWGPGWTEGWLAKLTGGPGQTSVRAGYGIFYNPIEQLVLEQFSAEPPFGGSIFLSNTNFNLPFVPLSSDPNAGPFTPNVFNGIIHTTPNTPTDWSQFRPMLLFGEFQPNLKAQYADQYNLTIERQLGKSMVMRVAYVGTEGHHLLATHDLNYGHAETCLQLNNIFDGNPLSGNTCGPFDSDSEYFIPPGTVIPPYTAPPGTPRTSCNGLTLPYNAGAGGNCVPAGTVVGPGSIAPNGIDLVGLRRYSSPLCQPLNVNPAIINPGTGNPVGTGCPADSTPVFSNIFAEDTIVNSNYNGLQLSLDRSFSHGLLFQMSYTFSKAIDQGASFENALDPLNFNFTRGLSLNDARNRFVFSPYWVLPVPKYEGFKGKALDGWGVSGIITYQSGFPIRLQTQDDQELMSSFNFEDPNTPEVTGRVQFQNPKKNQNFWFNTGNINDPGLGTFGNLPHSLCCGPALSNTDLSIEKKTAINERWNTEFRAEFYNAWNHTQFANPDGNFSDLTFGQIQKTREFPRVIQFGLKILF
jgi:Carboxypeptidase regulatory-like domain/TonB-dependent Receptor Plug Domain